MEDRVGAAPVCVKCGWPKKPIGRDAPLGWYGCTLECSDYWNTPRPDDLWPGEKASEFGYAMKEYMP